LGPANGKRIREEQHDMRVTKYPSLRILLSLVLTAAVLALSVALGTAGHASAHHSPPPPPPPTPTPSPTASPTPSASPDFTLLVNFKPPAVGALAQGAIPNSPCPPSECDGGLPEPAYVIDLYGQCFYDGNTLTVFPLNNFLGTVNLTYSGLPAGVTSLMPTSVDVTQPGGQGQVNFTFELQASPTAALGPATVTMTATNGALVHSLSLPISVGTSLPPLTPCTWALMADVGFI
jgi:hypothetical protein